MAYSLDREVLKLFKKVMVKDISVPVKYTARIVGRYMFTAEVVKEYSDEQLIQFAKRIDDVLFLTAEQLNSSFHKSWEKIRNANIEQLVFEQLVHYITTYGFAQLGIFDHDSVYIPKEKLDLPEIDLDNIELIVIRGITIDMLKQKVFEMLQTGIALKQETIDTLLNLLNKYGIVFGTEDLEKITNKEVRCALFYKASLFPSDPVELVRLLVYIITDKTLLIKSREVIEEIKAKPVKEVIRYLTSGYTQKKLAQVFYRFKPLFLAMKKWNKVEVNRAINKIRKLARKYHKPMQKNYLDIITSQDIIDFEKFSHELDKVNVFRKVRLYNALEFRQSSSDSIVYRIRNRKTYAKEYVDKTEYNSFLFLIYRRIKEQIDTNKSYYIPEYINYAFPTSEKNFFGTIPLGSFVEFEEDMVFGIWWKNTKNRIDLDLSLLSAERKYGWDGYYRNENRSILFSGDVTDAPRGASELFYIKNKVPGMYLMFVNYFNYDETDPVNATVFVAKEKVTDLEQNYMVNPNNVVLQDTIEINKKMNLVGVVKIDENTCKFYFATSVVGNSITSSNKEYMKHQRQYYMDYFSNMLTINNILKEKGLLVEDKEEAGIDLSPNNLTKDIFLRLCNE